MIPLHSPCLLFMCALHGWVTLPQLDKLASDGEGNQEAEAMLDKSEVESFVCGVILRI